MKNKILTAGIGILFSLVLTVYLLSAAGLAFAYEVDTVATSKPLFEVLSTAPGFNAAPNIGASVRVNLDPHSDAMIFAVLDMQGEVIGFVCPCDTGWCYVNQGEFKTNTPEPFIPSSDTPVLRTSSTPTVITVIPSTQPDDTPIPGTQTQEPKKSSTPAVSPTPKATYTPFPSPTSTNQLTPTPIPSTQTPIPYPTKTEDIRKPICHSGNGKNWKAISPNENGYNGHFDNKGKGDHKWDFFIDEDHPCPPNP